MPVPWITMGSELLYFGVFFGKWTQQFVFLNVECWKTCVLGPKTCHKCLIYPYMINVMINTFMGWLLVPHVKSSPSRFSLFRTSVFSRCGWKRKVRKFCVWWARCDGFFNILLFSPLFREDAPILTGIFFRWDIFGTSGLHKRCTRWIFENWRLFFLKIRSV